MKQMILGKMTDFRSRIRGKIWMCRLDFDVRALESKPSPSRCPSPEIWPKRNAVSYRTFHFLTIIQLDNLLTKKTFNQKFFVLMELNMFYSPQSFPIKNFDPKISFKNSLFQGRNEFSTIFESATVKRLLRPIIEVPVLKKIFNESLIGIVLRIKWSPWILESQVFWSPTFDVLTHIFILWPTKIIFIILQKP